MASVACVLLLAAGCAGRANESAPERARPTELVPRGSGVTNEPIPPAREAREGAAQRPEITPIDGYTGETSSSGDSITGATPDIDLDQICAASRQPSAPPDAGTDGGTDGGGTADGGAPFTRASDEPYCNYDPVLCQVCLDDQCGATLAACERGYDPACLSATDCRNWSCNGVCIEAQEDGYECGGFITSTWTPCDALKKDSIPPPSDDPYCQYDAELCNDCLADECPGMVANCELAGDPGCRQPCDTGLEPSCPFTDCRNWLCPAVCVEARQDRYFCEDGATQTWRPDGAANDESGSTD